AMNASLLDRYHIGHSGKQTIRRCNHPRTSAMMMNGPSTSRPRAASDLAAEPGLRRARAREHELIELEMAAAERAGQAQQVVTPHALEALVEAPGQARPRGVDVATPGHERVVVVRADVVHIRDDEAILRAPGELGQRRHMGVREDVAVKPRIQGLAVAVDA